MTEIQGAIRAGGNGAFVTGAAWCFWLSAWLRADESALDYSGLAIELGPADSEVNGYSLIREFADDYEDSLDESYENVFFTERADWNLARMKDVVNQRQKLLEAFEAGFRQEIFKFDQPISPATLVPVNCFSLRIPLCL